MFDKLEEVELKYKEIESRLSDPDIGNRPDEFRKLSQEHSSLHEIVESFRRFKKVREEMESSNEILRGSDKELADLAKEELSELQKEFDELTDQLQVLLLPKDPNDSKNIVLEIRAGAGGDEAGLFVADLFRMYQRYVEGLGWTFELMSANSTGIGGFKEIIAMVTGDRVYSRLKWEGGVHRVQRVPKTETQGRVHTSTVTVAILPEAEEVDVEINPVDLRIDVYRAGGHGGQGVNTTDSAVRITHLPTNLVVVCQDERSQLKNKGKAMKILRSRLLDQEQTRAAKEHSDKRRTMVGTGDRSERIRTYNFPQGRLTDHRIGLTLYDLPRVMEGDLNDILNRLEAHYQMEALKAQEES